VRFGGRERGVLAGLTGCALLGVGLAAQAAQPPVPAAAAEAEATSSTADPTTTTAEDATATTRDEPTTTTENPPAVGAGVLEGFQPSEVPGEVAAPAAPGSAPAHHRRGPRPLDPAASLAAASDSGGRAPSPWALAGLTPVAVLMASAAYSTWWRRRRAVPA
jgi:hypothetical protein